MIMKKNIYIALSILLALPLSAKIEILDRVAIIVEEGVVLESQVNNMLENIKKRYQEQGSPMPPQEVMLEQVQERLIIEELQLQMGRQAGIRVGDGELNQAFENIAQSNGAPSFTDRKWINLCQPLSGYNGQGIRVKSNCLRS